MAGWESMNVFLGTNGEIYFNSRKSSSLCAFSSKRISRSLKNFKEHRE